MTKPSTEKSYAALMAYDGEILNRGHAYFILKKAGQDGSPRVFLRALRKYESAKQVKLAGKNDAERRAGRIACDRVARGMSAEEVRCHLVRMKGAPDELFWACWKLFRHEGYWRGSRIYDENVRTKDFAMHFRKLEEAA